MSAPRLRLAPLLLAGAAAALTLAAGLMLFSTFMLYDDEGYVLFSIKNFVTHGGLYRDVYSQYGPFSYVLYYFLHGLGMPLTHTAGRLLTLAAWSGTASLSGWLVWRVTRHSACALATLAAVFVYLWVMVSEPNHPGGLIALITAAMGLLGYHALSLGLWRTWAALVGGACAALLLTKINVGAFATLSAMTLLLLFSRHPRVRQIAPWLVGAGLLVLPFALMRPLLGTPWVESYALLFALAAIPVAGALARSEESAKGAENEGAGLREWIWAIVAGAIVSAVVLGVIFVRGTSPADLVRGVVLGPLHHPVHFSLSFPWPRAALVTAAGSLALFLLMLAALRLGRPARIGLDRTVAWLRLGATAALALAIWRFPVSSPDNHVFAYSVSALWLFLWPLTGEARATVLARSWLGLLFLGQWLHPFPVPGSQIAWGTFLAIPLAAVGAWQAVQWLLDQPSRFFTPQRVTGFDMGFTVALTVFAVFTGNSLGQIGGRYFESRPLDLPGAEPLRLPDAATGLYRLLAFNANAHSDVVFSLPGMFSFNLWTDLPAPTLANVTHWFSLLDDAQQHAIIRSLADHPRACVIVQRGHLDFLKERHLTPSGQLYAYIQAEFETAFEVDGFEFRVHRGRHIAPLWTAEVFKPGGSSSAAAEPDTLVKLQLLIPPDKAIARIEVAQADDRVHAPLVLDNQNARIEVTPIDLAGAARGQPQAVKFPFNLRGTSEVAVFFNHGTTPLTGLNTLFVVKNAAGAELGLVRIRP